MDYSVIEGLKAIASNQFNEIVGPLQWVYLAAVVLILADLRFGVAAARKRGEVIRFSRAVRRTFKKMADYVWWIILAGAVGQAFGEPFGLPLLSLVILMVIFGCEINSCYSNYFESRGRKMKVNIFKYFSKKADIIEPEETKENEL